MVLFSHPLAHSAKEDPISGRLIFYDLEDELNQEQYNLYPPVIAHLSYWKDPNFYTFVRKRLL
jgi:hypothetical protein